MTSLVRYFTHRLYAGSPMPPLRRCLTFVCVLLVSLGTACTHVDTIPLPPDPAAQAIVDGLKQTNADLVRFKCVGKIILSSPEKSLQSYRGAIAGRLKDHLRVDLFAPYGGSAGTVASDGEHLYLVLHASRKYYKKPYGEGSLYRFLKVDITVGDLLELLVGRIPMDGGLQPQLMPSVDTDRTGVRLVDRWGKTRQWIMLDGAGRAWKAQWFDDDDRPAFSITVTGHQVIDGFVLPQRIDLSAAKGNELSIILERYEANEPLDEHLFIPPPVSS